MNNYDPQKLCYEHPYSNIISYEQLWSQQVMNTLIPTS